MAAAAAAAAAAGGGAAAEEQAVADPETEAAELLTGKASAGSKRGRGSGKSRESSSRLAEQREGEGGRGGRGGRGRGKGSRGIKRGQQADEEADTWEEEGVAEEKEAGAPAAKLRKLAAPPAGAAAPLALPPAPVGAVPASAGLEAEVRRLRSIKGQLEARLAATMHQLKEAQVLAAQALALMEGHTSSASAAAPSTGIQQDIETEAVQLFVRLPAFDIDSSGTGGQFLCAAGVECSTCS